MSEGWTIFLATRVSHLWRVNVSLAKDTWGERARFLIVEFRARVASLSVKWAHWFDHVEFARSALNCCMWVLNDLVSRSRWVWEKVFLDNLNTWEGKLRFFDLEVRVMRVVWRMLSKLTFFCSDWVILKCSKVVVKPGRFVLTRCWTHCEMLHWFFQRVLTHSDVRAEDIWRRGEDEFAPKQSFKCFETLIISRGQMTLKFLTVYSWRSVVRMLVHTQANWSIIHVRLFITLLANPA